MENILKTRIVLRNDNETNWKTKNPILKKGEMGVVYDDTTNKLLHFVIGDGEKSYNQLEIETSQNITKKVNQMEEKFSSEIQTLKTSSANIEGFSNEIDIFKNGLNDAHIAIVDLRNNVDVFKDTVETTFKDGVLDEAEVLAIKSQINLIENEKTKILKEYSMIANNIMLDKNLTIKNNLIAKRDDFNLKHNALIDTIESAGTDNKITEEEKRLVKVAFDNYKISIMAFMEAIKVANDEITDTSLDEMRTELRSMIEQTDERIRLEVEKITSLEQIKSIIQAESDKIELSVKEFKKDILDATENMDIGIESILSDGGFSKGEWARFNTPVMNTAENKITISMNGSTMYEGGIRTLSKMDLEAGTYSYAINGEVAGKFIPTVYILDNANSKVYSSEPNTRYSKKTGTYQSKITLENDVKQCYIIISDYLGELSHTNFSEKFIDSDVYYQVKNSEEGIVTTRNYNICDSLGTFTVNWMRMIPGETISNYWAESVAELRTSMEIENGKITQTISNLPTKTYVDGSIEAVDSAMTGKLNEQISTISGITTKIADIEVDNSTLNNKITTIEETANGVKTTVERLTNDISSISNKSLINNTTVTGNLDGWREATKHGVFAMSTATDFNPDATVNIQKISTTSSTTVLSETFEISPDRCYEYNTWFKTSGTIGSAFVGIHFYDKDEKMVMSFKVNKDGIMESYNGPDLINMDGECGWTNRACYIFPSSTLAEDAKPKDDKYIRNNIILKDSVKYARMVYYVNLPSGGNREVLFADMSFSEVPKDVLLRLNKAEQKITDEAIINTVTSSTEYTNKIGELSQKMSAAESRITDNAIISTVTNSLKYKQDIGSISSLVNLINDPTLTKNIEGWTKFSLNGIHDNYLIEPQIVTEIDGLTKLTIGGTANGSSDEHSWSTFAKSNIISISPYKTYELSGMLKAERELESYENLDTCLGVIFYDKDKKKIYDATMHYKVGDYTMPHPGLDPGPSIIGEGIHKISDKWKRFSGYFYPYSADEDTILYGTNSENTVIIPKETEYVEVYFGVMTRFDALYNDLSVSASNLSFKETSLTVLEKISQSKVEITDESIVSAVRKDIITNTGTQSIVSTIAQTPNAIKQIADNISLKGLVTIESLSTPNSQTIIDGSNIRAGSIDVGSFNLGDGVVRTGQSYNGVKITQDRGIQVLDGTGKERVKIGHIGATASNDEYGIKITNVEENKTILDNRGIVQAWQDSIIDNVEEGNGLELNIYVPENTEKIYSCILRFKRDNFRAYSKSTSSGGRTSTTSASDGGSTVSSSTLDSIARSSSETSVEFTTLTTGVEVTEAYAPTTKAPLPGHDLHYHEFLKITGHKHKIRVPAHSHSITIPSHKHSISVPSHTHSFSLPSHSHDINYGIHRHNASLPGVRVHINGYNRTSIISGYTVIDNDSENLEIGQYLNIGQWNKILLDPTSLGRISASVFVQAFLKI